MQDVTIRRALLSVSDKSGLSDLGAALTRHGVELVSTGGTAKALRDAGFDVRDISDLTGFPEMMDGRVKTLHPKVHGGLLAVRENAEHVASMNEHDIGAIDLVVVNLYPFAATVAKGADRDEIIENIDIGGPSMVRSAAKNHAAVTIVTDPADYARLMEEMDDKSGATSYDFRRLCAAKAYAATAEYDGMIANWFANVDQGEAFPAKLSGGEKQRVAIARALAGRPSVILADEPTAALDAENGRAVMALLSEVAKDPNRAVLAVTHDHRTLVYADRIIRIDDGRIVSEEVPDKTKPQDQAQSHH